MTDPNKAPVRTAARAFRSAAQKNSDIIFAPHLGRSAVEVRRGVMPSRARLVVLSLLAFSVSPALVLMTLFAENRALALFPTHDYEPGDFVRISGYGYPFAFREVTSFIDNSVTDYHWWIFTLDVVLVAAATFLLLYEIARAHIFEFD